MAAVKRLTALLEKGTVLLDIGGEIQEEYRRNLNPSGQPGTGDQFYLAVLNSALGRIERVDLPRSDAGVYEDFPADPALSRFDPSDTVFAALSRRERIPVVTATDRGWVSHKVALKRNGVTIKFLCGCDPAMWFQTQPKRKRR